MISVRWVNYARALIIALAVACPAHASDVDILIDKLVSKGILTRADALELAADIAHESNASSSVSFGSDVGSGVVPDVVSNVVSDVNAAPAASVMIPDDRGWWNRFSLTGDLRVRHEREELDIAPGDDGLDLAERDRWRIRWRAGMVTEVSDQWEVGFGLASGGPDGRSSNQTLRRGFSTGDARLDYAYARYIASENISLLAGKFKNPLWRPKDLLWDSDLRPEGVAMPMAFTLGSDIEAFVPPAYLVLSEQVTGSREDSSMLVIQAGATFNLSDSMALKVAPSYYNFSGLKGHSGPVTVDIPSNTRDGLGNLRNDYDAVTLGAQLNIIGSELVPRLSIFGEWVRAFDSDTDETGWMLGISFGDAKVAALGDWRFRYNYRRLEADAWPEFLPDSDHLFGATNVKGSEFEFALGLAGRVNVSVDYYSHAEFLGTAIAQDLLQIDLNLKW